MRAAHWIPWGKLQPCLLQGHRERCNGVIVGTSLEAGEDSTVNPQSKMTPPFLKNDRPGLKINEKLITLLIKNKTLEVKKRRKSKQTEKWHGGGICAQRTG